MNILVIYDSLYGNTEKIAQYIAEKLKPNHKVIIERVTENTVQKVKGAELIIIGSPTHGFNASENTLKFIKSLNDEMLKNKKIALFDTRTVPADIPKFFRFMIQKAGYASPKLEKFFKSKGCKIVAESIGINVHGKEGPIVDGEMDRIDNWINNLI